ERAPAAQAAHRPPGPFRGRQARSFGGGTRVPFLARCPGHVQRGSSDALLSHIDLLASFADLTAQRLAAGEGPDSRSLLATFVGQSKRGRDDLVEQGSGLALRLGSWKYIEPSNRPRVNEQTHTELGNDPAPQLYDLAIDPAETTNVAAKYPSRVKEMADLLQRIRSVGRSRP